MTEHDTDENETIEVSLRQDDHPEMRATKTLRWVAYGLMLVFVYGVGKWVITVGL